LGSIDPPLSKCRHSLHCKEHSKVKKQATPAISEQIAQNLVRHDGRVPKEHTMIGSAFDLRAVACLSGCNEQLREPFSTHVRQAFDRVFGRVSAEALSQRYTGRAGGTPCRGYRRGHASAAGPVAFHDRKVAGAGLLYAPRTRGGVGHQLTGRLSVAITPHISTYPAAGRREKITSACLRRGRRCVGRLHVGLRRRRNRVQ